MTTTVLANTLAAILCLLCLMIELHYLGYMTNSVHKDRNAD